MFNYAIIETLEGRQLLAASAFPVAIATAGIDHAAGIATDRLNNVIVAGDRNATILEDGPPGVIQSGDPPPGNFVSKYAPDGTLLWSRLFGAINISKVATDGENSIYLAGSFSNTADFDPRRGVNNVTAAGSSDAFVCKLSKNGNLLMVKTFGGKGLDSAQGLAVDSAGNMFIGGTFNARANFDPNGSFSIGAPPGGAGFIVALDHAGAFRWAGSFGGTGGPSVEDLALDDSGNVLATGSYSGNVDFDPSHSVSSVNVAGTLQAYVLKWNSSGAFVFADGFGGNGDTRGSAIASDRDGNIYSTGNFSLTADFNPGAGTSNLTAPATGQNYVTKLSSSGALVWAKSIGGASDIQFALGGIAVDKAKNVYVSGVFAGTKDFDPNGGTHNLISAGQDDIFIDKLDASGNFVFAKSQGGTQRESVVGLVLDRAGDILTTGIFEGTANFGTGADIINFTSEGNQDIYVSKLDSSGVLA